MICKSCGEDLKHYALGLCGRCYNKQYSAKYWSTNRKELLQSRKEHYMSNHDSMQASARKYSYTRGVKPASENKQCSAFLGVHVAERVLSKVFKDVEEMPYGHEGYDFICNKGKKIDVKSACTQTRDRQGDNWSFHIRKNQIADYFLCLAFDNREDLTPMHIWLIPAKLVNHCISASISESTLSKWDEYKLDINRVVSCCNTMKQSGEQ